VRFARTSQRDAAGEPGLLFKPLCLAEQRSLERNRPQGARHGWRAFLRQHRDVLSEEPAPGE
jgi:hypothetical protein